MRKLVLALCTVSGLCYAQDYKSQFNEAFQASDTLKQKEVLTKWEKADPKNAELFTSYFNYYFQKSRQELISLTSEQPNGESLSFQDSTGQIASYMGSQIYFDSLNMQRGLDKIEQGIKLHPNRLDMRFGKIYALGQVKLWDAFTAEIVKAVQYSNQNKNAWTWTDNVKKENGRDFFLGALQDYQVQLYNTGDDALLMNMRSIASEVLKFYPTHIESLSNLSITYLLTDEPDKAIEILLKAEKVDPKDPIILGNIAHAYKSKGDKAKAIEYYEKTILYADPEMVEYSKQQVKELKN